MGPSIQICKIFIWLIVLVTACNPEPISQDMVILLDVTELYFDHITMEEYKRISCIPVSELNGETTRVEAITELGYNPMKSYIIEMHKSRLFSNEVDRRNDTISYFNKIDSALSTLLKERRYRVGSVIYKILSEELNRLSESNANKRILVINSDLMENSFISFYNEDTFNELRFYPERIRNLFLEKYPLKDLNGIEVHIVYKPQNMADSQRFEIVSGFYKSLLESHKAHVTISANL